MSGITYTHPLTQEELPFLFGSHVMSGQGTGLVHTSPCHGHADFKVAVEHGISVVRLDSTSKIYSLTGIVLLLLVRNLTINGYSLHPIILHIANYGYSLHPIILHITNYNWLLCYDSASNHIAYNKLCLVTMLR